MPDVMHTSEEVTNLFKKNVEAAGLNPERCPAAVQMAVGQLGLGFAAWTQLLDDLPSGSRAYDWIDCALRAYAEFAAHTIVVDEVGGEGDTPGGEGDGNGLGGDGGDEGKNA